MRSPLLGAGALAACFVMSRGKFLRKRCRSTASPFFLPLRARKGYRIAGRFLQLVTYPPLSAPVPCLPVAHSSPSSTSPPTSSTSRRHYGRHHARGQSIQPAANKCKGLIRREVENAVLHSAAGGCHFSYDLQLSRMEVTCSICTSGDVPSNHCLPEFGES